MKFGRYGRNPGWVVVALVAIVYGVAVAFLAEGDQSDGWVIIGSFVVGALFVAFMVIPFIAWARRQRSS